MDAGVHALMRDGSSIMRAKRSLRVVRRNLLKRSWQVTEVPSIMFALMRMTVMSRLPAMLVVGLILVR